MYSHIKNKFKLASVMGSLIMLTACGVDTVSPPTGQSKAAFYEQNPEFLNPPESDEKTEQKSEPDIVKETRGQSLVVNIDTPSLQSGLLENISQKAVKIYLPPNYNHSGKSYPVTYVLAGFGSSAAIMYDYMNVYGRTNEWLLANPNKEMIIVFIDGVNELGGSFYTNSTITGDWEDYITVDIVNYIDSQYRTISDAQHRGLAGHSMGGSGVLTIGMNRPDLFSHLYSMSPGVFEPGAFENHQIATNPIKDKILKLFTDIAQQSEADAAQSYRSFIASNKNDNNLMFSLAHSSAFTDKTEHQAPYFNYIYAADGTVKQSAWDSIESGFGNVEDRIALNEANFKALKNIVLDVGTNDNYTWIIQGTRHFSDVLTQYGIEHDLREHTGNHSNRLPTRFASDLLPFFAESFAAK
ncbi:alpha/beta hydrolase [Algibacillus agarilyticus]|uniref:alpha/beta hydrolase n=1 Tax=Algibacillus agarilyticus TaxID=2234133 RepID=UPI000DD0DCED|nr:alpha/beta hydrolase-fold protein [Algibacillus agarilyticus]